jgi:GTPase
VHKGDKVMKPDEDPSQFSYQVSEMALVSALNALRFSQVVLLVVEGHQGQFSKVDLQLARKCLIEGRALVIAANKSDLLVNSGVSETDYQAGVQKHVDTYLREFGSAPVVACSAFEKKGVKNILDAVVRTHDAWSNRFSTYVMNLWLKELLVANPSPRVSGRALKLKYMTQIKGRPPSFAIFANMQSIPGFYERYLRTKLQEDFDLKGVPIRFIIRKTKGAEVRKHLLKQGFKSRRGVGHNEGMGVGKVRRQRGGISTFLKKKRTLSRDKRRRRDTRKKSSDK